LYFWELEHTNPSVLACYDDIQARSYTYGELKGISDTLLSRLASSEKKLAFAFCDQSIRSVVVYLSMLRARHTIFLGNAELQRDLKERLIDRYEPDIVWDISKNYRYANYVRANISGEEFLFSKGRPESTIHPNLALLLSTSGSTGSPKMVRLSYENIQKNAESIAEYLMITRKDCAITSLPFFYSFGISVLNSHLLAIANIVCTNRSVILQEFWTLFNKRACTSFAGVPLTYQLLKEIDFESIQTPSLRTFIQAGGGLTKTEIKEIMELAERRGIRFFVMYGQTEATARISYVPPEKLADKIGSIGIPIPGGKLSVYANGREVSGFRPNGELVYRGKNVMLGYAESRVDLEKGDERGGVLFTGDLAYRDADGFYYITGRLKRFIKIFGVRVNLDDVETSLEEMISKRTAAVGDDDKLMIAIESGELGDYNMVYTYTAKTFQIPPAAVQIKSVEALPLTDSMKKDYGKIKKIFTMLATATPN